MTSHSKGHFLFAQTISGRLTCERMVSMKRTYTFLIVSAVLFLTLQPVAAQQTKVACLGNSITNQGYPAILDSILGDEYTTRNFGVSGRCAQVSVDTPYSATEEYGFAQAYQADLAVILFGANDSKPWNWETKQRFASQYGYLIAQYSGSVDGKIYVCLPLPAFENTHAIDDSVLQHGIVPAIRGMFESGNLTDTAKYVLVDTWTPFEGRPELFEDGVHPNEQGKLVLAQTIAGALTASSAIRNLHPQSHVGNKVSGRPSLIVPVDRIPVSGSTRDLRGRTMDNVKESVPVPVITGDK